MPEIVPRLAFLPLLAIFVAAGPPARAEQYREPTIGYSGVMLVTLVDHAEPPLRVYRANRKIRIERAEAPSATVTIFDLSAKTRHLLIVKTKTYSTGSINSPIDPVSLLPTDKAGHRYTRVGDVTFKGVATTKYKVSRTSPVVAGFDGFVWRTEAHIVVKMVGTYTQGGNSVRMSVILTSLKIGPIDPKLFQVPAGYRKIRE